MSRLPAIYAIYIGSEISICKVFFHFFFSCVTYTFVIILRCRFIRVDAATSLSSPVVEHKQSIVNHRE